MSRVYSLSITLPTCARRTLVATEATTVLEAAVSKTTPAAIAAGAAEAAATAAPTHAPALAAPLPLAAATLALATTLALTLSTLALPLSALALPLALFPLHARLAFHLPLMVVLPLFLHGLVVAALHLAGGQWFRIFRTSGTSIQDPTTSIQDRTLSRENYVRIQSYLVNQLRAFARLQHTQIVLAVLQRDVSALIDVTLFRVDRLEENF